MHKAVYYRDVVSKEYERMNNRSSYEGRTADALALGADERRDKLR